MISEGVAFLDHAGQLLAADAPFRALLGLPPSEAGQALQARARAEPELAAFLAGQGPPSVRLAARADGSSVCELHRCAGERAGAIVRARALLDGLAEPAIEHAVQALVLARLAAGMAHEVRNSLNAMALQLALLGEKTAAGGEAVGAACAGNLSSMQGQIGRINDIVRRFTEVADPAPGESFDAAALLASAVSLFGPEARRRRIALGQEPAAGPLEAAGPPGRATRLVLGMLWRAVNATPEGGRLTARVSASAAGATVVVEHTRVAAGDGTGWTNEVMAAAAAEMGGRLEEIVDGDKQRAVLVLPRERSS